MRSVFAAVVLVVSLAVTAHAQVQGGSISGVVRDEQRGVIPGATVTAQSVDATHAFTTDANGRFRFLHLAPGGGNRAASRRTAIV